MCQLLQTKIVIRLRMALLFMAMVIMPICLAGCYVGKNGETDKKTESKKEGEEVTASSKELKLAVVCEPVGDKMLLCQDLAQIKMGHFFQ